MINYDEVKELFDKYIDLTYFKIKEKYFNELKEEDLKIFNHRNEMIKQKYVHTMRVVENIAKMARKMEQRINFLELTKSVGLLHDVGRFEQALYSDTYNDYLVYKDHPTIKNHGEEGEIFLKEKGFRIFDTPEIYQPAIAKSVGFHQANELPQIFDHKVDVNFGKIDPDKVLTGTYNFNEFEQKIVSLLLQMVRDIDKIDILYQRANGEIMSVPKMINVKNIGKENIIKIWGITLEDLKELNTLDEIENGERVKFYTKRVPVEKLFVKDEIKEMVYRGENIPLKELQARSDYSFITALWWSIYTFLSDINFVSNLEVVEENNLLNQIYERYPENYRPVIDEIFKYAKDVLINEKIMNNKNRLYLKK